MKVFGETGGLQSNAWGIRLNITIQSAEGYGGFYKIFYLYTPYVEPKEES